MTVLSDEATISAARRWRQARLACIAAPAHDVRSDQSFATVLNELSEAEDELSRAVGEESKDRQG